MNAPATHRYLDSFMQTAFALFNTGIDSLMPPACVLCASAEYLDRRVAPNSEDASPFARNTHFLCKLCDHAIRNSWPSNSVPCRFCGMPRPVDPASLLDLPCGSCPDSAFAFDDVIVLGIYQQAIREAVVAAKLARHASLAAALGRQLGELVLRYDNERPVDLITYVPSHFWRRIQRRSMGGVAVMAGEVAKRLTQPVEPIIRLTRPVKKQSMLPDAERPANVRDAFALKKSYAWQKPRTVNGLHILVVDDVLTTGSTASEIARILKAAGASRVTLAVVARAVRR